MSSNKCTRYYIKNGTITASSSLVTADAANKTFIPSGDCKFKLGNTLFNSDHDLNFTGEGALSFEGICGLDIGIFSVKANKTTEVKSISMKKTTVSFCDGSTGSSRPTTPTSRSS